MVLLLFTSLAKNTRKYIFHLTLQAYFFLVMLSALGHGDVSWRLPLFIIPKWKLSARVCCCFSWYGDVVVSLFFFFFLHSIVNCPKSDGHFQRKFGFINFEALSLQWNMPFWIAFFCKHIFICKMYTSLHTKIVCTKPKTDDIYKYM